MKLREFNSQNTPSIRNGVASISVNKHGVFTLNKIANELLKLKAKDSVVIHQDEEDPECFYIEKSKGNGFELRTQSSSDGYLLFNNSGLGKIMRDSLGEDGSTFRLLIAGKPTRFEKRGLWGLLKTSKA